VFSSLCRLIAAMALVAALSACVAGQSIDFKYQPTADGKVAEGGTVALQVEDERPYVTNKDQDPDYIGHYRGGFGNTWAVSTKDDRAFAEVMRNDLAAELQAMGLKLVPTDQAQSRIDVCIRDWNFDTYTNGRFWYLVDLSAKKADGTVIVQRSYKNEVVINGHFMTGAKSAFEEEMPKIYSGLVHRMLREDSVLVDGLKAR
jgi:hypothetical protein